MKWTEVTITTRSGDAESVSAALIMAGITDFQIDDEAENRRFLAENAANWDYLDEELLTPAKPNADAFIKFYLEDETRLPEIRAALGGLTPSVKTVDDGDWLNKWKDFYKPFRVGESIVVRPEWEEYSPLPDETVLTLNPGSLFGTGQHESTKMCLEFMEKYVRPGCRAADIGCGSGILSAAALKLGAESVFACDIEPGAAAIVIENARLSGTDAGRLSVLIGDVLTDETLRGAFVSGYFDLVAANIVADVIIPLCGLARKALRPGGTFIISGIIAERGGDVRLAAEAAGFEITEEKRDGEWLCFAAGIKE